ncbi:MAG TPA: hypothetical protein VGL22_17455 [Terracidiphilus sp.]|jgi:hypothetical protein
MDEEDGRPGSLAATIGQFDALMDALRLSLCQSKTISNDGEFPAWLPLIDPFSLREADVRMHPVALSAFHNRKQHWPKAVGLTAGGGEEP